MKKQLGRLFFRHRDNTHRHSERSEESKNIKFFGIAENKAENYGFFGRVPRPLNDDSLPRHAEFSSGSMWMLVRRTMSARTVPSVAQDEAKPNNQVQHDVKGRTQYGRSMIEMLGVLALVGILSIGGVAMYRRAVNNHHANSILDDANRYAFAITERGSFPANDNITNVNFEKTSTYEMAAFVGEKSGQYGILVGKLPKGVCEPLVDKANIDYKVRVMPAESFTYIDEIADTGLVYDSFNKDICINDSNDVVLFFGDTSGQCNKPKEGEDYAPCNTNAECCGEYFCAFQNPISKVNQGEGTCQEIDDFRPETAVTDDGQTWIYSREGMTWWSAQNWCQALGKKATSRTDLGCKDIGLKENCSSSKVLAARNKVLSRAWYWLEFSWVSTNYSEAYVINLSDTAPRIGGGTFNTSTYGGTPYVALCH